MWTDGTKIKKKQEVGPKKINSKLWWNVEFCVKKLLERGEGNLVLQEEEEVEGRAGVVDGWIKHKGCILEFYEY